MIQKGKYLEEHKCFTVYYEGDLTGGKCVLLYYYPDLDQGKGWLDIHLKSLGSRLKVGSVHDMGVLGEEFVVSEEEERGLMKIKEAIRQEFEEKKGELFSGGETNIDLR